MTADSFRECYEVPADVVENASDLAARVRDALRSSPAAGDAPGIGRGNRIRKAAGRTRRRSGEPRPELPSGESGTHSL